MLDTYDLLDDEFTDSEDTSVNVELEEYTDSEYNAFVSDPLEYPCLKIMDELSQEEYDFLVNKQFSDSTSLPLYCNIEGCNKRIGRMDLTLDNMLSLRQIYLYDIRLLKGCDTEPVKLELNSTDFLTKLIRV